MKYFAAILVSSLVLLGTCMAAAQEQQEEKRDSPNTVVHDGKTLDEWIGALKGDDSETHLRAVRALVEIGEPAYPALSDALGNPDEPLWEHTVEALVKIGERAVPVLLAAIYTERSGDLRHSGGVAAIQQMGETAHPALRRALRDDDQMVRFAAITALRMQVMSPAKDAAIKVLDEVLQSHKDAPIRVHAAEAIGYAGLWYPTPQEGVDALARALKDPDDKVKGMAAISLVRLRAWRGKDVVPLLVTALKSDEEIMPYFAVEALGQLGPAAEQAVPELLEAVRRDDRFVAAGAAQALGKIGAAAVPALLESLNSPNEAVRAHAARALGGAGGGSQVVILKLIAALKHEDAGVRAAAAHALGEIAGDRTEAVNALIKALPDSDRDVRRAAVRALGRMGSKAKAAVLSALQTDDRERRWEAATALIAMGEVSEGMPVVLDALEGDNTSYNIGAIEILMEVGPAASAAVPTLAKITNDEEAEPHLRITCAKALERIAPKDKRGITFLRGQLGKPDGPLALSAAFTLVELGEADDAVVDVLKPGLTSEHPGKLIACARALAQVESQRKAAVGLLRAELREKDKEMRVAAALALTEAGVVEPEAISILGAQLRLEDGSGRDVEAIRALAVIAGEDRLAQAILTEALHHETHGVREAARTALSRIQK